MLSDQSKENIGTASPMQGKDVLLPTESSDAEDNMVSDNSTFEGTH